MDGQTREGEAFGLKPNQAVRHGREARRMFSREENIISHRRDWWQASSRSSDALLLLVVTLHVRVFASVNL